MKEMPKPETEKVSGGVDPLFVDGPCIPEPWPEPIPIPPEPRDPDPLPM